MLPPARIDVVLAREADRAVVFRRGPSKATLVLLWDTATDVVTPGDWFRGRVYTKRCDLTPDGRYLVSFVATHSTGRIQALGHGASWTAISRVPSLEPLGRWSKDDCWGGGGAFSTDHDLTVNERPGTADEVGRHDVRVTTEYVGGEDEPVYGRRLDRDGWALVDEIDVVRQGSRGYVTERPELRRKPRPARSPSRSAADPVLEATFAIDGYTPVRTWTLVDRRGDRHLLTGATWADWDRRGRLVLAREGALHTARVDGRTLRTELIADLNEHRPPAPVAGDPQATR